MRVSGGKLEPDFRTSLVIFQTLEARLDELRIGQIIFEHT